jgi:uncharacterized Zn finger protein (UPF0148 family)
MRLAICPTCGTTVALDFVPTAGLVWCPTCEKAFSPSGITTREPDKEENDTELEAEANGEA